MLCYRCGTHVQDGSEFCSNCGQKFTTGPSRVSTSPERTRGAFSYKSGDLIARRYKVKSQAGSGAVSEVYRAHDSEIDVDVAVKVLKDGVLPADDEFKRFSAELKAARKLSHQNIVRLYDVDRDSGRAFYAMQLLEGLTLRKIITLRAEKNQLFTPDEAEPIISQVVHALEYAHQFSYHGDLKPENVIVLPDLLKVTDFYLLQALGRKRFIELHKNDAKTMRYIAPEIRNDTDAAGPRSDIYSLGVMLNELLTGEIHSGGPVKASRKNRSVPQEADRLIEKALSENPYQRHDSVTDFLRELNRMLEAAQAVEIIEVQEAAPEPDQEFLPDSEIQEIGDHEVEPVAETPKAAPIPAPASVQEPATKQADAGRRISFGLDEVPPVQAIEPSPEPLVEFAPEPTPAPRFRDQVFEEPAEVPVEPVSPVKPQAFTPEYQQPEARPGFQPVPAPSQAPVRQPYAPLPQPVQAPSAPVYQQPVTPYQQPSQAPAPSPFQPQVTTAEKPRLPTIIVKAQKRHLKLIAIMMGAFLAVAVAAGLIIWGQISKQHAIEQANLEKQRKEIEEQRLSLENAQKDLVAQLADAKKAAEARKAEEAKPEKKGVVAKVEEPAAPKVGPSAEEQRVKDLEERLQRVREQQEAAERRKADLEARKAEKTAKAEERRARLEEERAKAEERRAAEAEAASKAAEEKKRKDEAAQAAAAALAAKEAEPKCPKGMATVAAGPFQFGSAAGDPMHGFGEKNNDPVDTNAFCIDYYEFPNKAGARPKAGVSFAAAAQMCKKARKRLCSEAEWEKACKGPGNLRYPYGNTFDPAACITEDDQGNRREGGPAGSSKSCRSGYGVMDMSGNVSEWVLGEGGKSLLKGGSADKPSHAVRCAAKVPAPAAKTAPTIGFRCCADAN